MFDMLQLMRFSVYFKGILNTDNDYFHIKILISAAHMLGGSWAYHVPSENFWKKMQLGAFWCFFAYYIRGLQISSFACYMLPHSGPFLSFLAYYMGAPSDQFLRIEYGGPLRSVSSLIMEALCLFSYYVGALRSFLCILYWGPQITFFAYYMGPLRSLSSHTIWRATSDFIFFTTYMGASSDQFLRLLDGPPQVSFFAYYRRPPQISLFAYYMAPGPSGRFLHLLYVGAPLDKFLCGDPFGSVSSHTI